MRVVIKGFGMLRCRCSPNGCPRAGTEKYYLNITPMLQPTRSEEECRLILRLIAKMLVDGTFGH